MSPAAPLLPLLADRPWSAVFSLLAVAAAVLVVGLVALAVSRPVSRRRGRGPRR